MANIIKAKLKKYAFNTKSIDVVPSHVYKLAHQRFLLLCKNSTTNVPAWSISWIIIYTKYIFLLYVFPCAHSKDDDECGDDFTTNGWIFNTPSRFAFHNSFLLLFFQQFHFLLLSLFMFIFLCVCVFFLAILYNFSITFSTLMFLWSLELWKCYNLW